MEIPKKQWLAEYVDYSNVRKELNEYTFNGNVDISQHSVFAYDTENCIVFDNITKVCDITYAKQHNIKPTVVINHVVKSIDPNNIKTCNTVRIQLNRNYSLQDFFDENCTAKCIVFEISDSFSIFHSGYTIKAYIDNGKVDENNV